MSNARNLANLLGTNTLVQPSNINLAGNFAFTGTVSGAGEAWTEAASIGTLDAATETVTGIPSGTREVLMTWYDVTTSSNTPDDFVVLLGTSSGLKTSGYTGMLRYSYDAGNVHAVVTLDDGIANIGNWGSGTKWSGFFHCWNSHDDKWISQSQIEDTTGSYDAIIDFIAKVDLGAELDRIGISVDAGTINGGTIKVFYK